MRLVRLEVDPKVVRLVRDPRTRKLRAQYRAGSAMGPRHRRALDGVIGNDAAFLAWAEAPDRLWERAEAAARRGRITPEIAYDALVACAHELRRSCPTRLKSLVEARLWGDRQNLFLDGRSGRLQLAASELKYGSDDLVIPLTATERFCRLRDVYRPILAAHVGAASDNPYLIPAGGTDHKLGRSVGALYVKRNCALSIYLPYHVGRHLATWLLIEAGADLDLIARVLGHASPETTKRYYASLNRARDLRRYQNVLGRRLATAAPNHTRRAA